MDTDLQKENLIRQGAYMDGWNARDDIANLDEKIYLRDLHCKYWNGFIHASLINLAVQIVVMFIS